MYFVLSRLLDAAPELGVTDTQERVTPDLDRKKRVISREAILKQGTGSRIEVNQNFVGKEQRKREEKGRSSR